MHFFFTMLASGPVVTITVQSDCPSLRHGSLYRGIRQRGCMPFWTGILAVNDYSQGGKGLCPFPATSRERRLRGGHGDYSMVHSGHSGNRIAYNCYRHVFSLCGYIPVEMIV
jgi:hypothetical protein